MISIHTCIYIIYIYIIQSHYCSYCPSFHYQHDHCRWSQTSAMTATSLASLLFLDVLPCPQTMFSRETCYLNDDNEYTEMLAWLISCCSPQRSKKSICLGLKTRSHWNHHPLVGSHVDVHYETPGIVLSEQWVRSTMWGGKRNQSCELV